MNHKFKDTEGLAISTVIIGIFLILIGTMFIPCFFTGLIDQDGIEVHVNYFIMYSE